jgi:hypothetical protein
MPDNQPNKSSALADLSSIGDLINCSFNSYQDSANEVIVKNQIISADQPRADFEESVPSASDSPLKVEPQIFARRDRLMYRLCSQVQPNVELFIAEIAREFNCSPAEILSDLLALKSPETFQFHKTRAKASIALTIKLRAELQVARQQAVWSGMDKAVTFDGVKLAEMSIMFKCKPGQIVNEINRYKKFTVQLKLKQESSKKMHVIRALASCAKLNFLY